MNVCNIACFFKGNYFIIVLHLYYDKELCKSIMAKLEFASFLALSLILCSIAGEVVRLPVKVHLYNVYSPTK